MARKRSKKTRRRHDWVAAAYNMLAAGRYASEWLPEFLDYYDSMVEELGDKEAQNWARRELLQAPVWSGMARVLWILRTVYALWKVYKAVVG
jgi:hypothetical protein